MNSVQSEFVRPTGEPIVAGNSIIEGQNAGFPSNEPSYISCHAVSSVKSDGTDRIILLNNNPVGSLSSSIHQWTWRDFVWSLLETCPAGVSSQQRAKQ